MAVPVPGFKATTPFGKKGSWAAGYHTGADIAAPSGARVVAMLPGTVLHVGWGGWGNAYGVQVIIDHGGGMRAAYCHLSRTTVVAAAKVREGEQIGAVGTTGNSTGPHLHIECRRSPWGYTNRVIDPVPLFRGTAAQRAVATTKLSHLKFGQKASESVCNLQRALNAHRMPGARTLPVTGNYAEMTDEEVRRCQQLHGLGKDQPGKSFVGRLQAGHLKLPDVRP